ncbi:MAG: hypothetical protein JO130_19530, partial [Solirubrobacterales bacterium]|nr:hypothetical protein [Solirubrobacterales bacterium]
MRVVRWPRAQTTILAALTLVVLGAAVWFVTAATNSPRDSARAAAAPSADPADPPMLYATVGAAPAGPPRPAGFLGLSFEYSALEAYTGANPDALDPVFVQLLRNLAPGDGEPIVLRIGGNSTDATWWPLAGTATPGGVHYALTPAWLAETRALVTALPTRLIMGVNLAAGRPQVAAAEARAFLRGIGSPYVSAFEVGNEPDVYGVFPWYAGPDGPVYARGGRYDLSAFIGQLDRWQAVLPGLPVAGPALAELPWLRGLSTLLRSDPRLRVVTVHRYALQGCVTNSRSPAYPSIANLLSDRSSRGLAAAIAPYVALAHQNGAQFRVDELNSAALAGCLDRTGVSNTFASALWMLDTLFNLASVGVDGVNVHSLPGAAYELFSVRRTPAGWDAAVHPDYYGMLMFAQAFPPGARLLPVHAPATPVKVWASTGPDGHTRVTLINKDSRPHRVELQLP